MEWKSGMKVRCIESYSGFEKGDVFELTERYCFNDGWDTNPTVDWYIRDDMKKHWEVIDMKFTKDDLEVGYLVETRDGMLSMVMSTVIELVLIDKEEIFLPFEGINQDLTGFLDKKNDIMKVYGFSRYATETLNFTTTCRNLLWERKEVKELTMEDLERDYGCKVKIVKE